MQLLGSYSRIWRAALIVGVLIVAIAGMVAIRLASNWPFTEKAISETLEQKFGLPVQIHTLHQTYFPPGCIAEGVDFLQRGHRDLPPSYSVQTLTIRGRYSGLILPHKRLTQVVITGLRVHVSLAGSSGKAPEVTPLAKGSGGASVTIDEIVADGAQLEFASRQQGGQPTKFQIHRLTLNEVDGRKPIGYHVALTIPEPPGEIRSDGSIGPWDEHNAGKTPVSGSYTFEQAKLGVFGGISGVLTSQGKFSGTLGHMDVSGQADVPDFLVGGGTHKVHLISKYQAVVDGTNGDTHLENVESHFRRTTLVTKGSVAAGNSGSGKTAQLEMTEKAGRLEDWLYLFTNDDPPSMLGAVNFQAKVEVPPGSEDFLRKLKLSGTCNVGSGRFTNPRVQQPVNVLDESARGENERQEAQDPNTALSQFSGLVSTHDGKAILRHVFFSAPGTQATLQGTYNLLDNKVNIRGTLYTRGKLADTTTGIKDAFLTVITRFLKHHSVTVVPFSISGTSGNPRFALDLARKKRQSSLPTETDR